MWNVRVCVCERAADLLQSVRLCYLPQGQTINMPAYIVKNIVCTPIITNVGEMRNGVRFGVTNVMYRESTAGGNPYNNNQHDALFTFNLFQ
jgi:hypothetical protein